MFVLTVFASALVILIVAGGALWWLSTSPVDMKVHRREEENDA